MQLCLFVNPRSGTDSPSAEDLRDAARERGVTVHFLQEGDDLAKVAKEAGADVLGMAGGDGSLAAVAEIAIEQDVPFVCIPFGTRRLDGGKLHLYIPHGFRRITWEERSCTELEIGSPLLRIRVAVDGEPVELETPLAFRIEPGALRVLVPRAPE